MKSRFFVGLFLSGLLLVTSCTKQTKATPSGSQQEQQLTDNQIINIMMTIDKQEIAASKEATKRKVSPQVNLYAKYLIQQHQRNLDELTQLSKRLDIKPKESAISNSMITKGKSDLKALDDLKDNAFDKAYIDAMVKGHQEGLELINTKLYPQTKNPQLKPVVEQFRSMVMDHLEKGMEIQRTLT